MTAVGFTRTRHNPTTCPVNAHSGLQGDEGNPTR